MFGREKNYFKNRSRKELMVFFKGVVPDYVTSSISDLFFFAAVGTLSMFGTDEFEEILTLFTQFTADCEALARRAVERDERMLGNYPNADMSNWSNN